MEPTLKEERAMAAFEDALDAKLKPYGGEVAKCYNCGRLANVNDWDLVPDPAMNGATDLMVCRAADCGATDVKVLDRMEAADEFGLLDQGPDEPDWDAMNDAKRDRDWDRDHYGPWD